MIPPSPLTLALALILRRQYDAAKLSNYIFWAGL